MSVAYGIEVQQEDDPYVKLAEEANQGPISAAAPGKFLVDTIPVLKYVPAWFPGASFKREAREWYKMTRAMVEIPYADAKKRIVGSFTSLFCQNRDRRPFVGIWESHCFDFTDKSGEH